LLELCAILYTEHVCQECWHSIPTNPPTNVRLENDDIFTQLTYKNWLTPSSRRYNPYGTIAADERFNAGGIVI